MIIYAYMISLGILSNHHSLWGCHSQFAEGQRPSVLTPLDSLVEQTILERSAKDEQTGFLDFRRG